MGIQASAIMPNGVSKVTDNTIDSVGKVFTNFNKYLNSAVKSVDKFNDSLGDASKKLVNINNSENDSRQNKKLFLKKEISENNEDSENANKLISSIVRNLNSVMPNISTNINSLTKCVSNTLPSLIPTLKTDVMSLNSNDMMLSIAKNMETSLTKTVGKSLVPVESKREVTDSKKNDKANDIYAKTKEKIEQEKERNMMKYLDSNYVKTNNAVKKWNEYQKELANLKSKAVDTFGNNYKSNPEYTKALKNLNKQYVDEIHNANKQDFFANHKVLGTIADKIKSTYDDNKDSLRGILGPLNILVAPFEKFFGTSLGKFLGAGFKIIGGVFRKKRPTAGDVAKTGALGVGSLYIGSLLSEFLGLYKKKNKGGILEMLMTGLKKIAGPIGKFLSGVFGKVFGGLGKGLGKIGGKIAGNLPLAAGVGMIIAGLVWAAIDGIKGMLKAEDWGVSKFGGFLGGFLGGAEGGVKNAFKNAGKWALIGAGVGTLICPVVGTIAGGLIGAAVGGLLGAIGGNNLAKGFDAIGKWLKESVLSSIVEIFEDMFNIKKFKEIFGGEGTIGEKIGKALPEILKTVALLPFKLMIGGPKLLAKIFTKTMKAKNFKEAVGKVGTTLMNAGAKAIEGVKKGWEKTKGFVKDVWKGVKESEFGQFVSNIFTKMCEGVQKFFRENPVGIWMNKYIIQPIVRGLSCIGNFFGYIKSVWDWHDPIGSLGKIITANSEANAGGGRWTNMEVYGLLKNMQQDTKGAKQLKSLGVTDYKEAVRLVTTDGMKLNSADRTKRNNLINTMIAFENAQNVDDAIIRPDGHVIKTNPKDTIVALKDIPNSMNEYKNKIDAKSVASIATLQVDTSFEKKLNDIVSLLSKISEKNLEVKLPQQTRKDIDLIVNGDVA